LCDTVLIGVTPVRDGDTVVGAGLDNSLGVLTALLTAAALHAIEDTLRAADRRCLFVFTDQEEGPPEGFFGHGAARLAHTVPPPTIGCIVVDGQNAGPGLDVELGSGAAHGVVSGRGHGAIVPPNYHALALDLARQINAIRPGTVQMNTGFPSRASRSRVRGERGLGTTAAAPAAWASAGPPMTDPHTGHETARLSDIQDSVWWLAHFVIAALNMVPALAPRYGLGR
jgi:putative aminopeptidase FrvX